MTPSLSMTIPPEGRRDAALLSYSTHSLCFISFSLPQKLPIFLDGPALISLALVGLKQPVLLGFSQISTSVTLSNSHLAPSA